MEASWNSTSESEIFMQSVCRKLKFLRTKFFNETFFQLLFISKAREKIINFVRKSGIQGEETLKSFFELFRYVLIGCRDIRIP